MSPWCHRAAVSHVNRYQALPLLFCFSSRRGESLGMRLKDSYKHASSTEKSQYCVLPLTWSHIHRYIRIIERYMACEEIGWLSGSKFIVSCPDNFSHAEGKNSLVTCLFNFVPSATMVAHQSDCFIRMMSRTALDGDQRRLGGWSTM